MRHAATVIVLALILCSASSGYAARSKKLKTDGKTNDQGAAGMLTYEHEEVAAYNRGVTALKKKDYAKARKSFETALQLNDFFPEAHNNLAYTLRMQSLDNAEKSLKHYARALELAPEFAQARYYRAVLYVQLKRVDDAEADRAALEAIGSAEAKKFATELARVIAAGEASDAQNAKSLYGPLAD